MTLKLWSESHFASKYIEALMQCSEAEREATDVK